MTTTKPSGDVDAWEGVLAVWAERVQCEAHTGPRRNGTALGPQCKRAAVWAGREHEHGTTLVCTQHYRRWLRVTAADLAKKGYFLCKWCKGSESDRRFYRHEDAVTVRRL